VQVVHEVNLAITPGECLALVGESGSGKSTIARTIVGLEPSYRGTVELAGQLLANAAARRSPEQRRRLQIVFQDPSSALNPRETVATAIQRTRRLLHGAAAADATTTEALIEMVRLPPGVASRYPRELSGGERQRVCIARALACSPSVLVCDEVTSALDVSVQAAILSLLRDLRRELGLAVLFITHDMGVVSYLADRVAVLQYGSICELGAVGDVLERPASEYGRNLIDAAPSLHAADRTATAHD